jgi:predicted ATPase/class 3 adenylate cyclase/DNA-binding CsgD family transcriptional regulator
MEGFQCRRRIAAMESGLRAFLFTDLVGSTELLHEIGHERMERLRRAHFEVVRRAIAAHRGVEVKTIGDAFMVAFASTVDAVACAQAIQEGQAQANRRADVELSVRAGVSAGEATEENGDYFGVPVIEASRLCAAAAGGQVLVSDMARSMTPAGRFRFQKVGELALKGLPEPLAASELLFEIQQPAPRSTSFLGRTSELKSLEQALARACRGEGGVVLLAGEPGIGKTTLCEELGRAAAHENCEMLWGRCWEGEGAPAFWPWLQVVRAYARERDTAQLLRELGSGAPDIVALDAELQARLPGLPPAPSLEGESARFRLFDSMTTFLKNAAAGRPLLLLLEDLHWADRPSLLLLQFLAAEIGGAAVLVVATYRDVEVTQGHPLAATLVDLSRREHCTRLRLAGLSEPDAAELLERTVGKSPTAQSLRTVYAETEGNPLFLKEYGRLMAAESSGARLTADWELPRPVPETVSGVILRRLERLSAEASQVLTVAAVVGREFAIAPLETVSGLDRTRLLEALGEAESARLIAASPSGPGRYSFTHALVREALYDSLGSTRRVALHGRVGAALEELYRADVDVHLPELAHQYYQAAAGGEAAKAASYLRRAGDQAIALTGYEEAAAHYQRALQVLEAAGQAGPSERGELLLAAGRALRLAGEREQATALLVEAAKEGRRASRPEIMAAAAMAQVGEAADVDWRSPEVAPLLQLMRETLDALPEQDLVTRARLTGSLAYFLQVLGHEEDTKRADRVASELADRIDDPGARAYAMNTGYFVADPDIELTLEEQYTRILEIKRLAREGNELGLVGEALEQQQHCAVRLGWIDQARAEVEEMLEISRYMRVPFQYARAAHHQAGLALIAGRLDEAEMLIGQAGEFVRRAQSPIGTYLNQQLLLDLRRDQGRLAEVMNILVRIERRALDPHPPSGGAPWAFYSNLAIYYYEAGKVDEAARLFDHFARNQFSDVIRFIVWFPALAVIADAAVRLERREAAEILYGNLLPHAHQNIVHLSWFGSLGSTSHYLGMLAALLGRRDDARAHFDTALQMHAQLESPPLTARTQLEYARLLGSATSPAERAQALSLAAESLATAGALGMRYLAHQAEDVHARLRAGQPETPPVVYPDGLTEREVEVLRRIAGGRSNAEIAESLVLSVKTVERHVTNIYTKIGARGRADATAYVYSHGLADA